MTRGLINSEHIRLTPDSETNQVTEHSLDNKKYFQLDYRWVQTGTLSTEATVTSLSWNMEGTRLLTGGAVVQMWHQNVVPPDETAPTSGVTFEIGEECGDKTGYVLTFF